MTSNLPRRHFLAVTGGAVLAAAGLPAISAGATSQRTLENPLMTIPNLQQWAPGSGTGFALPDSGNQRIIIRSADAEALRQAAENLKLDLEKLTRRAFLVVVQDSPAPAAGEFVLARADLGLPNDEGYQIKVGPSMELTGPRAGVFHGVQTIVQWLKQRSTVPAGVARDWPKYPERGFLVANSARHYTMPWWRGQIQEMAYLKMNLLWIYVGYDNGPLAEMKEIAAYAARYNINVVPQMDMPGHMQKLLANRPDLRLPGRNDLDLSKDAAYDFARNDLLIPHLREFNTPYWHLGADEYLTDFNTPNLHVRYDWFPQLHDEAKQRYGASSMPVDILTGFLNDMNDTIKAHGKQTRIWNDGLLTSITTQPLDKDIIVEHWVGWPERWKPSQLLAAGYQVANSNGDYLYYDPPGGSLPSRRPEPAPIYNSFHPGVFSGETVPATTAGLRGAKLHLWTLPATEPEELQSDRLMEGFRSLSQVLWGSQKPFASYDGGFSTLITTIGRPPLFPVGRHTVSPVGGATSVWPHRPATVTFYDDIQSGSVQLREGGIEAGTPGRTTWDAATRTATFTPSSPWSYGKRCAMSFSARTVSGQQVFGEWSFTVASRPSLAYPRSLFVDEQGPAVERHQDINESELGVRFRVDRPGVVLGVKFYKTPGDFGTHTGSLWSSSGQRLATGTFTNESSMGWQELRFAQPVRIQANTTYTASYHTPQGRYGYNRPFFTGHQVNNGVLHAPADVNGVFAYGPSAFPTETYEGTNYWADVVFQPDTYTLFNVGDAPVFGDTEPTSLELGMRFSASPGKVHGVRFFKGTHNTGTHVGSLWTLGGQKLASATFTNETGSGWQEVRFAQPVALANGGEFVVSYSSSGGFSATEEGLATQWVNGALSTRTDQRASLYALSAGAFPTLTYQNRNYFVDVVYSEG